MERSRRAATPPFEKPASPVPHVQSGLRGFFAFLPGTPTNRAMIKKGMADDSQA